MLDACLGRIVAAIETVEARDPAGPGALLAITADHGNADELRDVDGHAVTAHSLNPVPFVLVGPGGRGPHARGRGARRRRADAPRVRRAPSVGRHDRPLPDPVIASVAVPH